MAKKQQLDDLISRLEEKEKESSIIYADEETEQVVVFSLYGFKFALPGKNISEILSYESITTIPGLPQFFVGLITLRGTVEAVIDPKKVLGLPHTEPTSVSRILIANSSDVVLGLLVDEVHDVLEIPISQIHPPLKTFDEIKLEFINGEFEYREKQVVYLSISKIFNKIADKPEE